MVGIQHTRAAATKSEEDAAAKHSEMLLLASANEEVIQHSERGREKEGERGREINFSKLN